MPTQVFINLPVADLSRSITFFENLGYSFNQQFTDETAACLVISDTIHSMLLTHDKFQTFIPNAISNAHENTEVLVALSCDSREEVDSIVDKAIELGGTFVRDPQDHGFMYERAYRDLDGHIWEYFWMDPAVEE